MQVVRTGLVISKPRRGTYVAEVLSEGLREIYAVRSALEEQATRLATLKQSCDLATLELELQGMRVAAAANDHVRARSAVNCVIAGAPI